MTAISKAQIIKIHAAAKENGIDNILLHDIVEEMTGKKSIRELTKYEAMNVIDKVVGKRIVRSPTSDRASDEQLSKIRVLERELGWDDNPKRLSAFIKKYAKVEQLHWLKEKQASNIIEALKQVLKKSQDKCQKNI